MDLRKFFKKLREIHRNERISSKLTKIDKNFYKKTNKYLKELKNSIKDDPFSRQELFFQSKRIITEICERRERKIVNKLLTNFQKNYDIVEGSKKTIDSAPKNLTPEEKELYFSLLEVLKKYREKIHRTKPIKNYKTIIILDNIPSIVGIDKKIYGPFREQDVVVLPKLNARIFLKYKKGKRI
ncbi:conserved hypothetical protein [Methanothermus fervidus DSM 2088]|uniref:Gins51 C-terminal domain-containing protein n=1 Tax=Methanothermus fervidus (strain ATCC 43054 / DSM 2088 / JCM 10308 / V24 S) TaxID=523846 RepID=E3GW51_METFV|nr:hypothetical protein [Methanothermus fervidus]ADP77816.1 conserved hypothetical protein [Methanothermus fervidus DSM 2088]